MTAQTRTLSRHKTLGQAIRSQRREAAGAYVKENGPGATPEQPWVVLTPSNKDSRKGH